MWDFGTVRHGGRTIGRSSVRAAGPPLTWENDQSPRADQFVDSRAKRSADTSGSSYSSSSTAKPDRDLPPPPSPSTARPQSRFEQSTVRHMNTVPEHATPRSGQQRREPSDEYEDYDDTYEDAYPSKTSSVHSKVEDLHLDDELPDTTLLDTVVLPAIASVSSYLLTCSADRQ